MGCSTTTSCADLLCIYHLPLSLLQAVCIMCVHVHVCVCVYMCEYMCMCMCVVYDTVSRSNTVGHDITPRCICMLCMTLFRVLIAVSECHCVCVCVCVGGWVWAHVCEMHVHRGNASRVIN